MSDIDGLGHKQEHDSKWRPHHNYDTFNSCKVAVYYKSTLHMHVCKFAIYDYTSTVNIYKQKLSAKFNVL